MAEPARRLEAVDSPIDAMPAPRRRPALFADYLPAEPIAPPAAAAPRFVQQLAQLFVVAALLLGAAALWSLA